MHGRQNVKLPYVVINVQRFVILLCFFRIECIQRCSFSMAVYLDAYDQFTMTNSIHPTQFPHLYLTDKKFKFSTSHLSELQLWRELTLIWLIFNLLLIKCEIYAIIIHRFIALNLKMK
jgi:hypothetical protein